MTQPILLERLSLREPCTVPLTSRLSVRLYSDCRPNCLETASLQKGLVLLWNGCELVEEGVGFGVPVVKYQDKTFFSSQAEVTVQKDCAQTILTKTYLLDMVSVKKLGKAAYINDKFYSKLRKTFELLYLKNKKIKSTFNKIMELRELANVKTEFIKVKPRGSITVTYRCQPTAIEVKADLSNLNLNRCTGVLLLNEQGASIFQRYIDSDGSCMIGNEIGAWEQVGADTAALQSFNGQFGFSVKRSGGSQLFRGYECTKKRFSWAGLSYSLPPRRGVFQYSIALNCPKN